MDVQEDGFLVLLNEDGTTKEDLKLPEGEDDRELSEQVKSMFESGKDILVSIMSAMGMEKVVGVREAQNWTKKTYFDTPEIQMSITIYGFT